MLLFELHLLEVLKTAYFLFCLFSYEKYAQSAQHLFAPEHVRSV